jgi:hypothetical protein
MTSDDGAPPPRLSTREQRLLDARPAKGLTLWAILAVALAPFSVATFGAGFVLGGGLIVVSLLLERRGFRARGPLVAGVVAVVLSAVSATAFSWFVLRPAEVTGREEVRQGRVERGFDRAFEEAGRAPAPVSASAPQQVAPAGDVDAGPGAHSDAGAVLHSSGPRSSGSSARGLR